MKIDKVDRRLLYVLDKNSRATYAALGKQCGISSDMARYRDQRLTESGILQYHLAIVDTAKLGFAYYKVLIKLHSASEANIESIIKFFMAQRSIAWIVRLEGAFDLGIVVCVTRIHQLSQLMDSMTAKFYKWISRTTFSVNVRGSFIPRDYLVGAPRKEIQSRPYSAAGDPYAVGATDREILWQLAEDSQRSAAYISRCLAEHPETKPLTPEAVALRIKKLEKDKVLTGYNIIIDNTKLGQHHYKILLNVNAVGKARIAKFVETCQLCPNIFYFIKSFGPWDYEADMEVRDVTHQRELMSQITKTNPGVVRDYQPLLITQIVKYNCFPR